MAQASGTFCLSLHGLCLGCLGCSIPPCCLNCWSWCCLERLGCLWESGGMIRAILNRKRAERGEPGFVARKRQDCGGDGSRDARPFQATWKPRIASWWAGRLLKACGSSWQQCGQRVLYRNMRIDSGCAGMGSCVTGIEALGLPVDEINASEIDVAVADALLHNHRKSPWVCVWQSPQPCATEWEMSSAWR